MSLKYSLTFLMLSLACVTATLIAWDVIGWTSVVFLCAALAFVLLAIAYAGVGPRLLLKRSTGHRPAWGWLLFAPYFLLNAILFWLYRLNSHEPAFAQVVPNLFFGRRLSTREAESVKWVSALDLAGEFAEIPSLRALPGYRSLPVLDTTAPTEEQLRDASTWLARATESGPVYVHCALGHGRSACVVIAHLLLTGQVDTITEGTKLLQSLRPGVRLHPAQRQRLRAFEPQPATKPQ